MTLDACYFYQNRDEAFRISSRRFSPPKIEDSKNFLYLCVFSDRLKVGVSCDVDSRIRSHERVAGTIKEAYLILLDRAEARRRENLVARCFGTIAKPGSRGYRNSEWFGVEHLAHATFLMRYPETFDTLWQLARQICDVAKGGCDESYDFIGETDPWAAPLGRAA